MNGLVHHLQRFNSTTTVANLTHLEAAKVGTLQSSTGNRSSVIDYTRPGNRLIETERREIALVEKSLPEIFGERLLRPLIDAVHDVGSSFFQKLQTGWQSVSTLTGRAISLFSKPATPRALQSVGDQVEISQTTMASTTLSQTPTLAISQDGNPVVAWNAVNFAYPSAIAVRILHPNGTGLTGEIITNTTALEVVAGPVPLSSALPNGNVFVTWPSSYEGGEDYVRMSGQVVTPQGIIVPSAQYLPLSKPAGFLPSSISPLQNGNIFVTGAQNPGVGADCTGGVISPNGTLIVNWFRFAMGDGDTSWIASSTLDNGNVFVVWKDNPMLQDAILGCVITPTGVPLAGCGFTISQPVEEPSPFSISLAYPNLVVLPNKKIFVSWSLNAYVYGKPQYDIYFLQGRVMAPDGTPVADQFIVNATAYSSNPSSLTVLPDGNIFSVFSDTQNIYGFKLTPSGTFLCDPTQINDYTIRPQKTPVVATLPNGDLFVVWVSQDEAESGRVLGRVLPPNFCHEEPATPSSSLSTETTAAIASGAGAGGLLLTALGVYACRRHKKTQPLSERTVLYGAV